MFELALDNNAALSASFSAVQQQHVSFHLPIWHLIRRLARSYQDCQALMLYEMPMEPLSAAASIIAVVGAARKAAEGLQSLKAIKDAPKELEGLLLEFSQIEIILHSYRNLPTKCEERSRDLATILDIAERKFDELDKLVHYTLTKAGDNKQVDRLQWVR